MKLKSTFSALGRTFMVMFHMMPTPREPTTGYTSRVPGTNKHIVPIDWDNAYLYNVEDELRALQEEFGLGDFHILGTGFITGKKTGTAFYFLGVLCIILGMFPFNPFNVKELYGMKIMGIIQFFCGCALISAQFIYNRFLAVEKVIGAGYHALCLDEVTLNQLRIIHSRTSCDLGFRIAPRLDRGRHWVLRFEEKGEREKPEYLKSLLSRTSRKQHLGSAQLLFANFKIPMELLQNSDGNENVALEGYLTGKRVK